LIGIGLLGTALAEQLRQGGFDVLGFDIDPARLEALRNLGGRAAASLGDIVRGAPRVLLSLPNSEVGEKLLAQVRDLLQPGQLVIDTTTTDPEWSAARGAELAARGVGFVDATVVGSSEQARQGDIVLLVGGRAEDIAACQDLFAVLARRWFHVGPWGSGARMKLVVNLVLGLNRAVLAEGLALAQGCGLDAALALEVLKSGVAYSRVMDTKGAKMLQRDFTPQARLSQHLKDVRLILAEGERVGARLPLSAVHRRLLEEVEAAGFGGEDNAAILRAFAK
jgi:3-hydroxyisobutyrate dehydrogenase-like beta-hydroxyacid dehydrogenase